MINLDLPIESKINTLDIFTAQVQPKEEPKTIQHKVVEGESLSKIAKQYNTTWQRLWSKNTNLNNQDMLVVGENLTIPHADEIIADRPLYRVILPTKAVNSSEPIKSAPQSGSTGLNGYEFGQCTGFVASKRFVPSGWGNATTWKQGAINAGWTVSNTPVAGAIAWTYGHVAYVESVGDGVVTISEQNYDWNSGIRTITVPVSQYTYIY
jgi:LysM repeat protein